MLVLYMYLNMEFVSNVNFVIYYIELLWIILSVTAQGEPLIILTSGII